MGLPIINNYFIRALWHKVGGAIVCKINDIGSIPISVYGNI